MSRTGWMQSRYGTKLFLSIFHLEVEVEVVVIKLVARKLIKSRKFAC